jgi:hypothetical protein
VICRITDTVFCICFSLLVFLIIHSVFTFLSIFRFLFLIATRPFVPLFSTSCLSSSYIGSSFLYLLINCDLFFINVTYLNCFGSIKRKCANYTPEIQSKVFIGGAAFRNKKNFHQQLRFKFNKETSNMLRFELTSVWC